MKLYFNFSVVNKLQEFSIKDSWLSGYCQVNLNFNINLNLMSKASLHLKLQKYNIDLTNIKLKKLDIDQFVSIIFNINSVNIIIKFLNENKFIWENLLFFEIIEIKDQYIKIQGVNIEILINYFNKFPLLDEKHIEFIRLKKIYIRLSNFNITEHLKRRSLQRFELLLINLIKK